MRQRFEGIRNPIHEAMPQGSECRPFHGERRMASGGDVGAPPLVG